MLSYAYLSGAEIQKEHSKVITNEVRPQVEALRVFTTFYPGHRGPRTKVAHIKRGDNLSGVFYPRLVHLTFYMDAINYNDFELIMRVSLYFHRDYGLK